MTGRPGEGAAAPRRPASAAIRPAGPEDAAAICAIFNAAIRTTTASFRERPVSVAERAAWLAEKAAQGRPVFVAELTDGRLQTVAGWATYGPWRAADGYRFTVENTVYVAEEWRGRGIGAALLAETVAHARAAGLHAMIAVIEASNAVSLRLHAQQGFAEVARFREVGYKFGRWLDLVFMELVL